MSVGALDRLIGRLEVLKDALSVQSIMLFLSEDTQFTDLIIRLNTENQLYEKGIDSTGTKLADIGGGYAPSTIARKENTGQPFDHITLRDSGDFYNSWIVFLNEEYDLQIAADSIKEGVNILNRWGREVVGLTETNLKIVAAFAKKRIQYYISTKLAA